MSKNRLTEAEWERLISEQQSSGQSQRTWCAHKGISHHTFSDRIRRMRHKEQSNDQAQQWVTVQGVAEPEAPNANPIQIELGSFRVIVPDSFNEVALLRVCKALVEIC